MREQRKPRIVGDSGIHDRDLRSHKVVTVKALKAISPQRQRGHRELRRKKNYFVFSTMKDMKSRKRSVDY